MKVYLNNMEHTLSIMAIAFIALAALSIIYGINLKHGQKRVTLWSRYMVWAVLFFAATQELLNIVIIQKEYVNYVFSLSVFYTVYASICFLVYMRYQKAIERSKEATILYIVFVGLFGLQFDWHILGDAPWRSTENLFGLYVANIGIFFFYGTIAYLSIMYTRTEKAFIELRRQSIKPYLLLMLFIYPLGFIDPGTAYVVDLLGTTIFALYFFRGFILLTQKSRSKKS